MNPVLRLVLSLSLGGSLMALLVLGLKWTLRGKLPSDFYYCAWLAVLLRLVLPLPGFMSLEGGREEAAPAAYTSSQSSGIPRVGDLPLAVGLGPEAAGNSPVSTAENTAAAETAHAQPVQENAPPAPARPDLSTRLLAAFGMGWSRVKALAHSGDLWLWLWAAGALATLLWYIVGYRRFGRALRRSLCRNSRRLWSVGCSGRWAARSGCSSAAAPPWAPPCCWGCGGRCWCCRSGRIPRRC